MSPVAHFIGSWLVATALADDPRDRRLITIAGVLPDADGLGVVADVVHAWIARQEVSIDYYQKFHHIWLHGWPGALAIALVLTLLARRRGVVALGCLLTVHLHLLCDFVGSRGPSTADLWPISYGEPLFRHPIWLWRAQWRLDGWQNILIFLVVFALSLGIAVKSGRSFVEVFSQRGDGAFVGVLRKWCRRPKS